jgi:hypothetical protein
LTKEKNSLNFKEFRRHTLDGRSLLETNVKHSNIMCQAQLNTGPCTTGLAVKCNSVLDPKRLMNNKHENQSVGIDLGYTRVPG